MKIFDVLNSSDGLSKKYLQKTNDDYLIETLYVDYSNKHIICFSSQVGCPVGCKFCYSGVNKCYYRNLTSEEIFTQCNNIIGDLHIHNSNKPILFSCMGVGEPLLNLENVTDAIIKLDNTFQGSKFALATSGAKLHNIDLLGYKLKNIKNFKLTISLHSANPELRNSLIPVCINLDNLVKCVKLYKKSYDREVEWNYVLINNVNDTNIDAMELFLLLGKDEYIKINQYNEVEGIDFKKSEHIQNFINALHNNGMKVEYYETNGSDINGACGQMTAKKLRN